MGLRLGFALGIVGNCFGLMSLFSWSLVGLMRVTVGSRTSLMWPVSNALLMSAVWAWGVFRLCWVLVMCLSTLSISVRHSPLLNSAWACCWTARLALLEDLVG